MKASHGKTFLNGFKYLGLGELHSKTDSERTYGYP